MAPLPMYLALSPILEDEGLSARDNSAADAQRILQLLEERGYRVVPEYMVDWSRYPVGVVPPEEVAQRLRFEERARIRELLMDALTAFDRDQTGEEPDRGRRIVRGADATACVPTVTGLLDEIRAQR